MMDAHAIAEPRLDARVERWQRRAAELAAPLHDAPPAPAGAEVENLTSGIARTRDESREAEATVRTAESDVTGAVTAGRDPAPFEARAEAASARLKTLRARLGPLEARLDEAVVREVLDEVAAIGIAVGVADAHQ